MFVTVTQVVDDRLGYLISTSARSLNETADSRPASPPMHEGFRPAVASRKIVRIGLDVTAQIGRASHDGTPMDKPPFGGISRFEISYMSPLWARLIN